MNATRLWAADQRWAVRVLGTPRLLWPSTHGFQLSPRGSHAYRMSPTGSWPRFRRPVRRRRRWSLGEVIAAGRVLYNRMVIGSATKMRKAPSAILMRILQTRRERHRYPPQSLRSYRR